jgi:hypothetical protein
MQCLYVKSDAIQGKLIRIKWIQFQLQIKIDFVTKNFTKIIWTFLIIKTRKNKTLNVNSIEKQSVGNNE